MPNRVVHFEIPYDNGDRARSFYQRAFGWEMMSPPGMGYTLASTGPNGDQGPLEPGFINGGLMERQGEFSAPIITIHVDNIEEALKAVGEAGGRSLLERQTVGDMGFSAYFIDTEGNVIGLWETAAN